LSKKSGILELDSVDSLRQRVEELERWFQTQDRQILFLERERQKLSALTNHTDAGFLVFDTQLQVRWMNNVCRDWFGAKEMARCTGNGRDGGGDRFGTGTQELESS
jgi:PAS domain-containing protein